MDIISYNKPSFSSTDIKKINNCLRNGSLTEGKYLNIYEDKIRHYSKCKYSIALNSATSALHVSCLALGLKSGDYLWTSANSFVASANCGLYCGAKIRLIDIDSKTWNLDLKKLKEELKIAEKNKKLPKILVNVLFGGLPNYPEDLKKLSKKYKFKIIDDASHAFGSKYKGKFIGNCKYSDITVFSTHPVKMFTTCEGGIINTNNTDLYEKAKSLRSHGIIKNKKLFQNKENVRFPWYFEQKLLGFNYRLNEVESIIGINQIKNISKYLSIRKKIATLYKKYLDKDIFLMQEIPKLNVSSYHLFVVRVKNFDLNKSLALFNFLNEKNIKVQKHYIPIYKHPYYKKIINQKERKKFVETEKYYNECISLPIYAELKVSQVKMISQLLNAKVKEILT